jgi:acyl carrier protein/acetyltransferase-like isoleucine patch superfamily enzyme
MVRLRLRNRSEPAEVVRSQATSCGGGLRVQGRTVVRNDGVLVLGDDVVVSSAPSTTHLVTGERGVLQIGHRVEIGHGGAIACHESIVIGDDVVLGAFVAVMDYDFHAAGHVAAPVPRPVMIEPGARIGHRVVVLPGARIGAGAVVHAGSVVAGIIPAGAHVAGNPATVAATSTPGAAASAMSDAAAVVQRVFYLSAAPGPADGTHNIAGWDSLGALELLVELEAILGTMISEQDAARLQTVADVQQLLGPARPAGASAAAVIARVFGLGAPPGPDTLKEAIPGWDSLGMLELVLAVESEFDISVDERHMAELRSVGDLERLVATLST